MARPRKPTHLKLVQGNPGKRALPDAEPQPAPATGEPPPGLSPAALAAWDRLFALLGPMGVITEADADALVRLCECYAEIQAASESLARPMLDKAGEEIAAAGSLTYVTYSANGAMLRSRPEVAVRADAERRFQHWLSAFGLTPAARSKVSVPGGGAKRDPLAHYFG